MSRRSENANAVVNAVEQVLDLYGVQYTREQSRVIMVEGAAGRPRPMYFGKWRDDYGEVHSSGRFDLLARPRVVIGSILGAGLNTTEPHTMLRAVYAERISVPLWIECKSGRGTLSPDQRAFAHWVDSNGDFHLVIHDDITPLIQWLDAHGVVREPKSVIHAEPMTTEALDALPCRHCGRDKAEHQGKILACGVTGALATVWSPKLRAEEKRRGRVRR